MFLSAIILGLVPALLTLLLAFVARARAKRLPASPGPRFSPMPGATVLNDALMMDADRRAIAAMLIDMAVSRRIRLLTPELEPGSRKKRTPVGIEVIENAPMSADEVRVIEVVFGPGSATTGGQVRRLSDGPGSSNAKRSAALDPARSRLRDAGFFRAGRRWMPVILLHVLAWLVLLLGLFLAIGAFSESEPLGGAILLGAVAIAISALFVIPQPWRKFLPAAEPVRAHLAGLREYMQLAEADQLRMLQSTGGALLSGTVSPQAQNQRLQRFHLHEKLLPYAVLFGIEKSWAQSLKLDAQELSSIEGLDDVLEATSTVFEVLEFAGDVAQLVTVVVRATGGVFAIFEALDF